MKTQGRKSQCSSEPERNTEAKSRFAVNDESDKAMFGYRQSKFVMIFLVLLCKIKFLVSLIMV